MTEQLVVPARVERHAKASVFRPGDEPRDLRQGGIFGDMEMADARMRQSGLKRGRPAEGTSVPRRVTRAAGLARPTRCAAVMKAPPPGTITTFSAKSSRPRTGS